MNPVFNQEQSIKIAKASNEIEGYTIDKDIENWAIKALNNEITQEEYISFLKLKAGVLA